MSLTPSSSTASPSAPLQRAKINAIYLYKLRNEEHFQFMTDSKALVEAASAQALRIEQLFTLFTETFNQEQKAIERIRASALTNPIAELDNKRDRFYRALTLFVEAFSYSPKLDEAQAAHTIQLVLDHYGDPRALPYNEETATIFNLLMDLNKRCAAELVTLNAQNWLDFLHAANKEFEDAMAQRFHEQAGEQGRSMREERQTIDAVYNQMVERLNALMKVEEDLAAYALYADFAAELNERISYFNTTLAIRRGRSAAMREKAASATSDKGEQAGSDGEKDQLGTARGSMSSAVTEQTPCPPADGVPLKPA